MKYSVEIRRKAQKELAKITQPYRTKIIETIKELEKSPYPHNCKKLSGREAWRIRVGDYRIIYEVNGEKLIILIIKVGHRREIYK